MTEESPVQPRGRDHVPRDELLELVEEFRDQAALQEQFGNDSLAEMANQHAGELEALLDT